MNRDEIDEARREAQRYQFHNLTRIPDFARMATDFSEAPRRVRWVVVLFIVGVIMTIPAIAIVLSVLG